MRKFYCLCIVYLAAALLAGIARAETFQLNDGQTLSGAVVSYNENGLIVRLDDQRYSDRVPWTKFSQDDLKKLAQNSKIAPFVEPFIEVTQKERIQHTEVPIVQPPRLARPVEHSLFGALFSSSVGIFALLLIYGANIYAAYEVSIFRAQPAALVCGLAAIPVLGFLSPIIFLSMPTRVRVSEEDQQVEAAPTPTFAMPAATPEPVEEAAPGGGGLRLAHGGGRSATAVPDTQVFQRGAFTFNRRFFETKFVGFFPLVRREADRNLVLVIKVPRTQYICQRITRITGNEMHLQVQKGAATEEVMVSFSEIQEVQLKHKDA